MTDTGDATTSTSTTLDPTPASALHELTLRELLRRLATSDPVPGGGSASALAGALAAALTSMVTALTEGRTGSDEDAATIREIAVAAASAQSELLNLVTLDASAYDAVVQARRLPRDTEAEQRNRRVQVEHATRQATDAPLQTARTAARVLGLAERLVPVGNRHAISDVGVAAHLAAAAMRGAALNVRINLPGLTVGPDDELASAGDELEELLATADEVEARVAAAVAQRMEG